MSAQASEPAKSITRLPGIYARGLAMGAADVVPGVSGGTLALITGIYEELIDTLGGIGPHLIGTWRRDGFASMWRQANLTFLLVLLAGIFSSIAVLASVITRLLESHPVPMWAFFCGLIGASVWLVLARLRTISWPMILNLLAGFALAWWIGLQPGLQSVANGPLVFFASGALAICAMILPGISGSFILLLLGMYQAVLSAVHDRELALLLAFVAGCAVGLLLFVRVLKFMLHRFHDPVMGLLAGFMAGSLNKLWPWRVPVEGSLLEQNLLPSVYTETSGLPAMQGPAALALVFGALLVWLLYRAGSVHNEGNG